MSSERIDEDRLRALHTVRVRGLYDGDGIGAELAALEEAGLVRHRTGGRREGWVITSEGLERHEAELAALRKAELVGAVAPAYEAFLRVNQRFKDLCTDWQTLGASGAEARSACAEELAEIRSVAAAALTDASRAAPWLASYADRLDAAARRFEDGDDRYLTSPLVESVHTIWAEAHEDFLVTLGRERSEGDGA
jgi:hypothetical protein